MGPIEAKRRRTIVPISFSAEACAKAFPGDVAKTQQHLDAKASPVDVAKTQQHLDAEAFPVDAEALAKAKALADARKLAKTGFFLSRPTEQGERFDGLVFKSFRFSSGRVGDAAVCDIQIDIPANLPRIAQKMRTLGTQVGAMNYLRAWGVVKQEEPYWAYDFLYALGIPNISAFVTHCRPGDPAANAVCIQEDGTSMQFALSRDMVSDEMLVVDMDIGTCFSDRIPELKTADTRCLIIRIVPQLRDIAIEFEGVPENEAIKTLLDASIAIYMS